ncbi:hypothetical protein NDS46_30135 (plasmid) [Paenibacillus thiaminolyticus]|uniref:hypothetical protein n=1 Tax=Paenibacillus thiaminolyticus TaxID=49283 RepID=UPI00232F11D6|nr:hypothetical protein [Paenibacillus thiaminolyticus]WCF11607.1 hypothetical protein NDS46_30135 [Paenibacillus thiaminolyticus]
MIVKCGRKMIELTEKDVIMYNGACYQIITRNKGLGWNESIPKIAKAKAQELIKKNLLVNVELEKPPHENPKLLYYKVNQKVASVSGM